MSIPVVCPSCHAKMRAPETAVGRKARCPKCKAAISVPVNRPSEEDVEALAASILGSGDGGTPEGPFPEPYEDDKEEVLQPSWPTLCQADSPSREQPDSARKWHPLLMSGVCVALLALIASVGVVYYTHQTGTKAETEKVALEDSSSPTVTLPKDDRNGRPTSEGRLRGDQQQQAEKNTELEAIKKKVAELVEADRKVRAILPLKKKEAEEEVRRTLPVDNILAEPTLLAIDEEYRKRKMLWDEKAVQEMAEIGKMCLELRRKYPDDQQLADDIQLQLSKLKVFEQPW